MAQSTLNVAAASPVATGGVLVAPLGTPLPTGPTDTLDPAFIALGYVSEDGVQFSGSAASVTDTLAWGGDVVANVITAASVEKRTFKLLEILNPDVLRLAYGANHVTITTDASGNDVIHVEDHGVQPPKSVFVFDMLTSQGTAFRRVIPIGQPVMSGQDDDTHKAIGGYEFEVTAFNDTTGKREDIWHYIPQIGAAPAA